MRLRSEVVMVLLSLFLLGMQSIVPQPISARQTRPSKIPDGEAQFTPELGRLEEGRFQRTRT